MARRAIKLLAINLFVCSVSALAQGSGDPLVDLTDSSQLVDDNNFPPNLISFAPEMNIQGDSDDFDDQKPPVDLPGLKDHNQICAASLTIFKLQMT